MTRRARLAIGASAIALATTLLDAQSAGVFFGETWESGTISASFSSSGYTNRSGFFVQSAERSSGTWALEHRFPAGLQPGAIGYLTQHFGDSVAGPVHAAGQGQHFYDVYVQYKVYYSSGFDFANRPKQLIIGTQDDRRHDNACCNPWVSHYMTIYPPLAASTFLGEANNKQNASGQWLGFYQNQSGYGATNRFAMQAGRWYTVEVRRRLNDAGFDNGIFQMWVDGTLLSEHRDVRYRVPWNGSYGANLQYGTNFAMISDYMGQPVTRDESVYYDDVKISTTYIGSGAPAPPTNLRLVVQ